MDHAHKKVRSRLREVVIPVATKIVGTERRIIDNDSSGIVKGIPIEQLDAVRAELKAQLSKDEYRLLRVR